MNFFDRIVYNIVIVSVLILIIYCCYITLRLDNMWQMIIEQKKLIETQEQKIQQIQILMLKKIGVIS
tara:strand:+ start:158 stop:358 length:201 start_codon:yes stop_codon:yes gene_type:complete